MSTKEYDLIKSTVECLTKMKKELLGKVGEYFDYETFNTIDLDDDEAVSDFINKMPTKCKWLSIWATKGLDKENMELDYDEETNKWTLTF